MTDITKCGGYGCPMKESCWRYIAPDGARQSYADLTIYRKGDSCEMYYTKSKTEPSIQKEMQE